MSEVPTTPAAEPWTAFDEATLLVYTDMVRSFRNMLHTKRRDSPEVSATLAFIQHYTKLYPKVEAETFRRYGSAATEANSVQPTQPSA